ncbi:MAG: hypothetical protein ACOC6P_00855 [Candidatus Aminicenantaceae bacterium]
MVKKICPPLEQSMFDIEQSISLLLYFLFVLTFVSIPGKIFHTIAKSHKTQLGVIIRVKIFVFISRDKN